MAVKDKVTRSSSGYAAPDGVRKQLEELEDLAGLLVAARREAREAEKKVARLSEEFEARVSSMNDYMRRLIESDESSHAHAVTTPDVGAAGTEVGAVASADGTDLSGPLAVGDASASTGGSDPLGAPPSTRRSTRKTVRRGPRGPRRRESGRTARIAGLARAAMRPLTLGEIRAGLSVSPTDEREYKRLSAAVSYLVKIGELSIVDESEKPRRYAYIAEDGGEF